MRRGNPRNERNKMSLKSKIRRRAICDKLSMNAMERISDLELEVQVLRQAITETLDENGHLADGDICTLSKLKKAIEK